jgi:hypothetical protein
MPNATATRNNTSKADNEQPQAKPAAASLAAATDEYKAVEALSKAGWPGRTATETLDAARKLVASTGKLAGKAADDVLAKAAAKAAGSTGLAAHDRDRVASLFDGKDIATAPLVRWSGTWRH